MQQNQPAIAPEPPAPDAPPAPGGPPRPVRSPLLPLAAVAAAFALVQLLLVVPGRWLGWDETVYVSQVDPRVPAAFFSAPRARGVTFLVAPVLAVTSSPVVLHSCLALLSAAALVLGLWLWRGLLPTPVLVLAGALFAGLWPTLFYGPQVMPNLWVAFAGLAATGWVARAVTCGRAGRREALGVGAAVAVAALMRPTDAVWLACPLLVSVWWWGRGGLRRTLPVAVLGGLVVGGAQWVVEAYTSYGGLARRLHRASEIQGGLGWHVSFDDQVRALQGSILCRPCTLPWRHPETGLWWFALGALTVAAAVWVAAAGRGRAQAPGLLPVGDGEPVLDRTRPLRVALLAGTAAALPYLLTVDYAAPRFLLPAYVQLVLPAAWVLFALTRTVAGGKEAARGAGGGRGPVGRVRPWAVAVLIAVLLGHEAVQFGVLRTVDARTLRGQTAIAEVAEALHGAGVRSPCVISGEQALRIAYRAGCASRQVGGHDGSITGAGLVRLARSQPVAVVVPEARRRPRWATGWRRVTLPVVSGLSGGRLRAYVALPGEGRP
ncbi:hypothetical protein ACFV3R_02165 [Streptomyces sp. NPDC059740]|uniref:hypothetical protein n=1 Tax=Streptomyces sp. NPDC059740 TaxID=3346926 RepID=UPI00365C0211